MEMLKLVFLILPIVCVCSCRSTTQPLSNSISDISNISTIYDGGSTRADLTLHDGSVWVLSYNRNLSDKDHNIASYNSLIITQIKPCRGESSSLPKGGIEEMKWLCLLSEFQANNPRTDKEDLVWVDVILKEKNYSGRRGQTRL